MVSLSIIPFSEPCHSIVKLPANWEKSGPKDMSWGPPTGVYTCQCWVLFMPFRQVQIVGTEEGLEFPLRVLMEMHGGFAQGIFPIHACG